MKFLISRNVFRDSIGHSLCAYIDGSNTDLIMRTTNSEGWCFNRVYRKDIGSEKATKMIARFDKLAKFVWDNPK